MRRGRAGEPEQECSQPPQNAQPFSSLLALTTAGRARLSYHEDSTGSLRTKLLHAATGTRDTSILLKEGKLRHASAVRPYSGWHHALATFPWSKRDEPSTCSTSHPYGTLFPACHPRDAMVRRSPTQLRVQTPTLQRPPVPHALSPQLL